MSDLSTKISTANHRFVASISTHDLVGLLTQADLVGRPFTVLSELVGKILNYSGIRFTENIALGDATNAIYSEQLSSGEKQMLSFLCHNAFQKNSIIFIDEPELSLHVDWQRLLFPMLLKQGTDNQFIVATHSPFIYSRYPDKEIILDSDRGGE
jgi:ABC-type lipoprotein export system ATPase subunit